jgi:predicted nuclease of predicted toxin-antitoxin system
MKFLVDAQLPEKLKFWLIEQKYDTIYTNDLPLKHLTPDIEIIRVAEIEGRIIISKDSDFYKYNLVNGVPERILFLTIGNSVNNELIRLFELNFKTIEDYFVSGSKVIEFSNSSITVHF